MRLVVSDGVRSTAGVTMVLLAVVVWACISAGFVLSSCAGLPMRADAVVVLGGDGGDRYKAGRQLVLDGVSRQLLLINASDAVRQDTTTSLLGADVRFDDAPRNTWQEAQAVRVWMQAQGWKTVLVVSDPPHMLRVGYAFASNLRGTGLGYALVASSPLWWSAWQWWANPVSTSFVISEVVKLGYYLVHYRFGLF